MVVHLFVIRVEVFDRVEGYGILDVTVFDAAGRTHLRAELVRVVVAMDGGVVFLDALRVDVAAVLRDDPFFELHVSGMVRTHVVDGFLAIESKRIECHLIEAAPAFVVIVG